MFIKLFRGTELFSFSCNRTAYEECSLNILEVFNRYSTKFKLKCCSFLTTSPVMNCLIQYIVMISHTMFPVGKNTLWKHYRKVSVNVPIARNVPTALWKCYLLINWQATFNNVDPAKYLSKFNRENIVCQ